MMEWIKKYFWPHVGNNYEPHLLKTEALAFLLAVIVAVEIVYLIPTFFIIPSEKFGAAVLPAVLIDLTNADRQNYKLPTLKANPLLARAAQLKAEDMAARSYFSHIDPDGREPWYWFNKIGYRYRFAGENLAVNFFDSSDIEKAWMSSPLHRDNILKKNFTEIGIGAAQGFFEGYNTVFIVQFFGRPALGASETEPGVYSLDQNFISGNQLAAAGFINLSNRHNLSSFFDRLVTSPRLLADTLFAILVIIILLVAMAALVRRGRKDKSRIFINTLIILLLILSIVILNHKISSGRAGIATTVGHSMTDVI